MVWGYKGRCDVRVLGLFAAVAALVFPAYVIAQQYGYTPPQQPQQPQYRQDDTFAAAPSPPPQLQAAPALGNNQNGFQQTGRKLSLSDKLAQRAQNGLHGASTVINIAVGDADNANNAIVFPLIAGQAPASLSLHADPSIGSYESATGVCLGIDAAAIVQMDAAIVRAVRPVEPEFQGNDDRAPTSCRSEMQLRDSLYPQIGYLIVSKESKYSSMHSLLSESGREKVLAVGLKGSGGAITLQYLLKSSDNRWHASVQNIYGRDALAAVEDNQVDGYFVMESPNSHFITDVVNQYDGGNKFKLIAINPYDKFFEMRDGKGRKVYQAMNLPGGGFFFGHTASISVDTVLIVNSRFAQGNNLAVRVFLDTVRNQISEIRKQTGTPDDWKPASRLD
jgi:hypothetical protein